MGSECDVEPWWFTVSNLAQPDDDDDDEDDNGSGGEEDGGEPPESRTHVAATISTRFGGAADGSWAATARAPTESAHIITTTRVVGVHPAISLENVRSCIIRTRC